MALWQWQHTAGAGAHAGVYEAVEFVNIAGWAGDDHAAALAAFIKSAKQAAGLPALLPEANAALRDGQARRFFETYFKPHRVVAAESLLTGYYEPELQASLTCSAAYSVPIYRRPDNLELAGPGDTIAPLTAGHRIDGRLLPYFTRAEIEGGALAGQDLEIAFAADAVDLFVMHVQGSGLLKLADGGQMRLTFAGKNGHPYTSLAKLLIACGELPAEGASLAELLAWLRADAERGRALMRENQSYIFFEILDADSGGPRGSLGAPLTPGRSLAVDPSFHRLGLPVWIDVPALSTSSEDLEAALGKIGQENKKLERDNREPVDGFRRLMVAQDTGSAIRGAARGDIFWGCGEAAGALAGCTKHCGDFYVLLPRRVNGG